MQCVILAGGLGTRMAQVDSRVPKTLLEISGKPFAHWQLSWLASEGITSVVYSIGHLGDQIVNYVGDGSQWGIEVSYVNDGDRPLGTGGALRRAADMNVLEDHFFVIYGDSYLNVSLREMLERFDSQESEAMMCVYENDNEWDTSNVIFDGQRVVQYEKNIINRPQAMTYIDYGVSLLGKKTILEQIPAGQTNDLTGLLMELSVRRKLAGFESTNRFYEIGTPTGLGEFKLFLDSR